MTRARAWLRSDTAPGKGSAFRISLPLQQDSRGFAGLLSAD